MFSAHSRSATERCQLAFSSQSHGCNSVIAQVDCRRENSQLHCVLEQPAL